MAAVVAAGMWGPGQAVDESLPAPYRQTHGMQIADKIFSNGHRHQETARGATLDIGRPTSRRQIRKKSYSPEILDKLPLNCRNGLEVGDC
jgi:hypothetical protein